MTRMPHVTVVTITRNHREGLQRTLASIEAQDWPELSLTVVDGDSTDGTKQLLQELDLVTRFTWTSERDRGIYDAMNKGWRRAAGDLVVFMNAGDSFSRPDVVTRMATSWAEEEYVWGYGLARVLDVDGRVEHIMAMVPFSQERLRLGISTVPHQACVMTRSLLEHLGGFDESAGVAADQSLILRASTISPPRLWAEFFADFEGGGLGSTRSPKSHLLEMEAARRRAGLQVGTPAMDRSVTIVMRAVFRLLTWQSRLRRRMGVYR